MVDRHARLIAELVSAEGQLGATLRAVYDSADEHPETFVGSLDAFKARMDADIERTCNKYYQGFIESIDELLKVRASASDLQVRQMSSSFVGLDTNGFSSR